MIRPEAGEFFTCARKSQNCMCQDLATMSTQYPGIIRLLRLNPKQTNKASCKDLCFSYPQKHRTAQVSLQLGSTLAFPVHLIVQPSFLRSICCHRPQVALILLGWELGQFYVSKCRKICSSSSRYRNAHTSCSGPGKQALLGLFPTESHLCFQDSDTIATRFSCCMLIFCSAWHLQ